MDFGRAREILNAPEVIEVLYNGSPIWIDELNYNSKTALISATFFEDGKKTVPIDQLVEAQEKG